jgi:hypothetical protein
MSTMLASKTGKARFFSETPERGVSNTCFNAVELNSDVCISVFSLLLVYPD